MAFESTQPSLLSRVRDESNQAAWREFDAKYRELILRYGRLRGLQTADAEDVHQLIMISLSKALRGFDYDPTKGRFRDYLGRIVRNTIARRIVRPNPAAVLLDSSMEAACSVADAADDAWDREWMDHHYRLAMAVVRRSFDPQSVEIFDKLLTGEDVESLAASYHTSTQAVHKIKQRIRDRLKELIAAQIHEEDQPDG